MLRKSVDEYTIELHSELSNRISFYSRFGFLRTVKGLRPGCLNGFIGTTGSGKSTLIKTIVADTLKDCNCLVWLSEESVEEYQPKINTIITDKLLLDRLFFIEEKKISEEYFLDQRKFFFFMKESILKSRANVLIIDNITTSYLYSEEVTIKEQGRSALFLSKIAKELNIAIVYVAHTKKTVNDTYSGMITKEDIRGSQKIVIMTEYLYILQKFQSGESAYPIMQICKHRFHEVNDRYYVLHYKDGNYTKDKLVKFELVKQMFRQRDVL